MNVVRTFLFLAIFVYFGPLFACFFSTFTRLRVATCEERVDEAAARGEAARYVTVQVVEVMSSFAVVMPAPPSETFRILLGS